MTKTVAQTIHFEVVDNLVTLKFLSPQHPLKKTLKRYSLRAKDATLGLVPLMFFCSSDDAIELMRKMHEGESWYQQNTPLLRWHQRSVA